MDATTQNLLAKLTALPGEENFTKLTEKDFAVSPVTDLPNGQFVETTETGSVNVFSGGLRLYDGYALVSSKMIDFTNIPHGSKFETEIDGSICSVVISKDGKPRVKYNGMFCG